MTSTLPALELPEIEARGPLLERICPDLVEVHRQYVEIVRKIQHAGREKKGDEENLPFLREQRREIGNRLKQLDEEVQVLGGVIAEAATGTIEFLGELDGGEVMLSWRPGDEQGGFWRPIDGQPGDRLPIPYPGSDGEVSSVSEEDETQAEDQ